MFYWHVLSSANRFCPSGQTQTSTTARSERGEGKHRKAHPALLEPHRLVATKILM